MKVPKEVLMIMIEYSVRMVVLVLGVYVIQFIKHYKLEKWVDFSVRAAEQLAEAGIINWEEKKEFARQSILERFKLTDEELNIYIEAAVEELNRVQEIYS